MTAAARGSIRPLVAALLQRRMVARAVLDGGLRDGVNHETAAARRVDPPVNHGPLERANVRRTLGNRAKPLPPEHQGPVQAGLGKVVAYLRAAVAVQSAQRHPLAV